MSNHKLMNPGDNRANKIYPVRVLVIGLYASRGGVETSTMNYYRNLDHGKVQYDFINPYEGFYFGEEITELGGRIYQVANFRKNPLKYVLDICRIIKANDYKVVNIPMLSAVNPLAVLAAKIAGAQNIVLHSHNSSTRGALKKFLHFLNKPIVNVMANYYWACSTEASRWLFYKNVRLVNNAINLDEYSYSEQRRFNVRKEFGIKSEFVIGNVARLTPVKNQTFLLDILVDIHKSRKDAKLLIVGSGVCLEAISKRASQMGIKDKVILAGDRSDVAELYSAMDVFVLPSIFEGLPMVGVEAQAAGLKVVCTDSITAELDVSGRTAYVGLNAPVQLWASEIMNSSRSSSDEAEAVLTSSGYNIKVEARKLQDFYTKLHSGDDGDR